MASLHFQYPLPDGGAEYSFGEYIWAVRQSPVGGWEIAVELWTEQFEVPSQVVASGFTTSDAAVRTLLENSPALYAADGAPMKTKARAESKGSDPLACLAAREAVLAFRSEAWVERGLNRDGSYKFRVLCIPGQGKRPDLSDWCPSSAIAWLSARHNLGLDFSVEPPPALAPFQER